MELLRNLSDDLILVEFDVSFAWKPMFQFRCTNAADGKRKTELLADRTNGRVYATLLRMSSSSACDVMYYG